MNNKLSKSNHNTEDLIFNQYPIRLLKFILAKLKIRELFGKYIRDPRTRVDKYDLTSLLMHGLFTHIFRCRSKNEFRLHLLRPQASRAVAHFNGQQNQCPSTRTLDDVISTLNPEEFQAILPAIFRSLLRKKVFQLHPEFTEEGQYSFAIDAQVTHVYHADSQHPCETCPYCLKRTRSNKIWYIHFDVVVSFVSASGLQIPVLFHRIRARPEWEELSKNKWKQECERTAFPHVLKQLKSLFPRLRICIHLDALYATDSILSLLEELKMGYSIVRKRKVLKTVGEDCEGLKRCSDPIEVERESRRFKIHQTIYFFNDIPYRSHKLSLIQLDEHAEKKLSKRKAKVLSKKMHWEWIVSERLNAANVAKTATKSRLRWREEEEFNDVQNHDFAICHDFNRNPTAQLARTFLILIAYAITSILVESRIGKLILAEGKSIMFMMREMLNDLIRIPEGILFGCRNPRQLRFGKDPPA